MLATRITRQLLRGVRDRRPINRGVRVLAYHGVVETFVDRRVEANFHALADFRAHLRLLRRCNVIELDEIEDARRSRHIRPCVVITFDDGFHNNVLAAELLAEAKLPATIFLATENVTRGETIWPTLLRLVLARGSARTVRIAGTTYALDSDAAAFGAVRKRFKDAPSETRTTYWSELASQLRDGELAELMHQVPSITMMTWRDASAIAAAGIRIGSHGALHELQHAAQPHELRVRELVSSRVTIEAQLGRACRHFAFPNGTFHDGSAAEVAAAGYTLACTMVSRAAGPDANALLLPRIVPGAGLEKLVSSLAFGN